MNMRARMLMLLGIAMLYPQFLWGAKKGDIRTDDGAPVVHHMFMQRIAWFGQAESSQAVTVISLKAGRVVRIHVTDESKVQSGQPLFQLGGKQVEDQMSNLEEQVAQSKRAVAAAGNRLASIKRKFKEQLANKEQVDLAVQALAAAKGPVGNGQTGACPI